MQPGLLSSKTFLKLCPNSTGALTHSTVVEDQTRARWKEPFSQPPGGYTLGNVWYGSQSLSTSCSPLQTRLRLCLRDEVVQPREADL